MFISPWTRQEVNYLRQHAGVKHKAEIASNLHRSEYAVQCKANRLGISLMLHGEHHHLSRYEDSDVELARCLAEEGLSTAEIARKFEAPYGTVRAWISYQTRRAPCQA